MDKKISKAKVYALIATFLAAASTFILITLYDANGSLKTMLNDSKINNEQLLSEKLSIEKELHGKILYCLPVITLHLLSI
ncbi:MAG: hypothetical protein ACK4IY_05290 [Chitinophagales bacterium]